MMGPSQSGYAKDKEKSAQQERTELYFTEESMFAALFCILNDSRLMEGSNSIHNPKIYLSLALSLEHIS